VKGTSHTLLEAEDHVTCSFFDILVKDGSRKIHAESTKLGTNFVPTITQESAIVCTPRGAIVSSAPLTYNINLLHNI
jgi:hypothetical protein